MEKISDLIEKFDKKEKKSINLIASENYLSKYARRVYNSEISTKYCFDDDEVFHFPGREILLKIEKICIEIMREKLNAKYVNVKTLSGMNCLTTVIGAVKNNCECFLSLNPNVGGHGSTQVIAQIMGLNCEYISLDNDRKDIDIKEIEEILSRYDQKKTVLYIDHANILFPINIKQLKKLYPKLTIIYDISHIMGLILGQVFENPLNQGADLIVGSTHKTFPGPHKGIIATNNLLLSKKIKFYTSVFVSHEHIADIAALAILLERNRYTFNKYAERIVKNANIFGKTLLNQGLNVIFDKRGVTQTHQVWIVVSDKKEETLDIVNKLAFYGINVNTILIPFTKKWGIRVGVQEISQKWEEDEVMDLALIFSKIYKDKLQSEDNDLLKNLIQKYHFAESIIK